MGSPLDVDFSSNVVDIFSGDTWSEKRQKRFTRLAPEIDDMEIL
jgi:hypothetical protein